MSILSEKTKKLIIHHKVIARVICVFSEQDTLVTARAKHQQRQPSDSDSTMSNTVLNTHNLLPLCLLPIRCYERYTQCTRRDLSESIIFVYVPHLTYYCSLRIYLLANHPSLSFFHLRILPNARQVSSTSFATPALSLLQTQLHNTQTSLLSHVDKIHVLLGIHWPQRQV